MTKEAKKEITRLRKRADAAWDAYFCGMGGIDKAEALTWMADTLDRELSDSVAYKDPNLDYIKELESFLRQNGLMGEFLARRR